MSQDIRERDFSCLIQADGDRIAGATAMQMQRPKTINAGGGRGVTGGGAITET
jgi:hypothetical protein